MKKYTEKPFFFNQNRVYKVYTGGSMFDRFLGSEGEDNNFPEEWIASTVHADNNSNPTLDEGLSKLENTEITLKELGKKYSNEMCGSEDNFNVLVKYLDSTIRLTIQAHPDKVFSRKYFNSEFGKTKMWLISATREGANGCFGFNEKITKQQFSELEIRSRTDKKVMDEYLNRIYVKPGEVYLIPAKAVHAIGAGCLMLEVQEPTDFTMSPEFWCGDHLLSDHEMYMGLDKDVALDCFDYSVYGKECISLSKKEPKVIVDTVDVKIESLINAEDTPCFSVLRSTVKKEMIIGDGPAAFIITKGSGVISGENYCREVGQGDYFFMPYNAKGKFSIASNENSEVEIITCMPTSKNME